ncbi:hypothetical protein O181_027025 [Austropuccinia psidii MF-1]|uniref:Uncharacterized protein n=1 Tax=Austropuccinia psidii MF-1 TaxID=1389203 RepID=A0A9Q3CQJ6_9BASI|nr:hypothetical protein [Austropuccinia psidii MF-1]
MSSQPAASECSFGVYDGVQYVCRQRASRAVLWSPSLGIISLEPPSPDRQPGFFKELLDWASDDWRRAARLRLAQGQTSLRSHLSVDVSSHKSSTLADLQHDEWVATRECACALWVSTPFSKPRPARSLAMSGLGKSALASSKTASCVPSALGGPEGPRGGPKAKSHTEPASSHRSRALGNVVLAWGQGHQRKHIPAHRAKLTALLKSSRRMIQSSQPILA